MAAIDYSKAMDEYQKAKDYELQQQAVALQQQIDQYSAQRDKINKNYTEAADTAYNNAQLTSRGRAENLAAMGLGRGYYDAPSSGYGQQLIGRADTELRDALNKIGLEKADKLTDVDNYISQAQAAAKANSYTTESTYAQKLAELLKEQTDAQAQYDLQMKQLIYQNNNDDDDDDDGGWNLPVSEFTLGKANEFFRDGDKKGAYQIIFNALPKVKNGLPSYSSFLNVISYFDGLSNADGYQEWWENRTNPPQNGWGLVWF